MSDSVTQKPLYDIYATTQDNKARFVIGRHGSPTLYAMGLNPSTSNQFKSDTTISKIRNFAARNGYPGFAVLNLYPLRVTDPNNLPLRPRHALARENLDQILAMLRTAGPNPVMWAAWGNIIDKRPYFRGFLEQIHRETAGFNLSWICAGSLTTLGHPRHPSRLPYQVQFQPFDIEGYLKKA